MVDIDNTVVLGASLAGGLALTYYMTRKEKPVDPFYDFENQSVEIDVLIYFKNDQNLLII